MANKPKTGLDYFPMDVNIFADLKIRKLIKYQGGKSITVYAYLLCNIYSNGYYIKWDNELPFVISESTGYDEAYITEVIKCCLSVGIFSKSMFENHKVITSKGIQERYEQICRLSKRKTIVSEFMVNNSEELTNNTELLVNNSEELPQSKVKESKGKKTTPIGVVAGTPAPDPNKELKKEWDNVLVSIHGKSPKECWLSIREFITGRNPKFIDPYCNLWNVFAGNYGLSKVEAITDARKRKFNSRINEQAFDFIKILEKIKISPMLKGIDTNRPWKVSFDWIFENQSNYVKILEGNYDPA